MKKKRKWEQMFVSDYPLDHIHTAAIFLWHHAQAGGCVLARKSCKCGESDKLPDRSAAEKTMICENQ